MSTSAFGVEHVSKSLPSSLKSIIRDPKKLEAISSGKLPTPGPYAEKLVNAKSLGSIVPHLKDGKKKAAAIRMGRSVKAGDRPSKSDEKTLGNPPKSWKGPR